MKLELDHLVSLLAKTRPLPPLPPRLECAAAGPQSLKLKWGDSNAKTHAADDMGVHAAAGGQKQEVRGLGVHPKTP